MESTTYTNFRKHLRSYMDEVNENADTILVTRNEGHNIVVMSETDYHSVMETMYLLSNPANSNHLEEAMAELDKGNTIITNLEDL